MLTASQPVVLCGIVHGHAVSHMASRMHFCIGIAEKRSCISRWTHRSAFEGWLFTASARSYRFFGA